MKTDIGGQQLAYIALGANVGTQPQMLARMRSALELLRDVPEVTVRRKSSVYRTPAWGVTDQPDFLNAAVELRTRLSPKRLLCELKCIEQQLGRVRREKWGPREIDLDVLLFDERAVQEEGLTIPHAGLLQRAFVLIPLLEIAPEATLPDGREVKQAAGAEVLSLEAQQARGMCRLEGVEL
ncbi:MAG: 2-amino-4-hydroxy-6-hydroxymethyldihydropteridine diphosphokinase [Candidatus Sumerlaeaceae bacterium]